MSAETKTPAADPLADRSPCHNLALRQAARHVSQAYDRHLAPTGLRGTQYSILAKLGRLGPLSIGVLADAMVMERTALSRAIGPLARDGLVKVGGGADGRTRRIELTAAGRGKLKLAAAHWRKAQAEFEKAYGAAEADALRTALWRVVKG